ncbi:MAG: hypothetical protein J6386_13640 [Candidatus Synoicihabitans palmerolidicus]|nr:hypothetical protein [Candidatus Synoicihabitans palmerolidicus]
MEVEQGFRLGTKVLQLFARLGVLVANLLDQLKAGQLSMENDATKVSDMP